MEKGRSIQDGQKRHTERLEKGPPLVQQRLGQAGIGFELAFVFVQWPAKRPRRERRDDVDDVRVGVLREPDGPVLGELDPGQQLPGARRGPPVTVNERPLERHRRERDAFARVVPYVHVGLVVDLWVVIERSVGIGQQRAHQVARPQKRRDLYRPGSVADQVERADQLVQQRGWKPPRQVSLVQGQRHRRVGLVRIRGDGDAIPARTGHHKALGQAMEQVRRDVLREGHIAVVHLQDDTATKNLLFAMELEIPRLHILDYIGLAAGGWPEHDGCVECPVSHVEIGAHVQRRHALVRRHRIEPPGIGFRRQQEAQFGRDRFVDPQQVLDGVAVLKSGEPAERGALVAAGCEIRVDQCPFQRPEHRLDDRAVGLWGGQGWHLALLEPLIHLLPGLERLMVGEIEPEAREVQGGDRPVTVAPEAGRLDQRRDSSLKRLGRRHTGHEPPAHQEGRPRSSHRQATRSGRSLEFIRST